MPIVSLIFGKTDFTTIGFHINDTFFGIGLVIQAVIVFFIVAWVLFLIIKLYNRYLAKPMDEETPAITEVELLTEIRDELHAAADGRPAAGSATVAAITDPWPRFRRRPSPPRGAMRRPPRAVLSVAVLAVCTTVAVSTVTARSPPDSTVPDASTPRAPAGR